MPPKPNLQQLPNLDSGPVPLVGIRDQARKQLLEVVDSRRGRKALVLDPAVSGPLSLLDTQLSAVLTEHGVAKLLYLEPGKRLDDPTYNAAEPRLADIPGVIYLVRPTLANVQAVAAQVKAAAKGSAPGAHDFSLVFVPRRTIACERVLEEEGVLGDVAIGEYALDMVPCEDDVLSLELDGAFADCVADGDPTPLYYTAAAITRLQALFGVIPRVQGKGPAAVAVRDMCFRMRRENPGLGLLGAPVSHGSAAGPGGAGATHGSVGECRIDRMVLLDREVDVVTPMMTQITFEGLVDEVTGIKHGSVPWEPKDKRGGEGPSTSAAGGRGAASGRTLLNSTDPFYREFRDLPFHVAIGRLQQHARDARRDYNELGSKDLSELKSYVKGLHKLSALDRLSDVAVPPAEKCREPLFHERRSQEQAIVEGYQPEASIAFIEELMYRGGELVEVLRLLVLLSTVGDGLPRRALDSLRSDLLHTYGHQHLLTLNNLERAGLLKAAAHSGRSGFSAVRKALQLIVPEQDGQPAAGGGGAGGGAGPGGGGSAHGASGAAAPSGPSDVSHLYKGYAPVSIRLVEAALRSGWAPLSEVLLHLPGSHFDVLQSVDNNGMPQERPFKQLPPAGSGSGAGGGAGAGGAGGGSGSAGGAGGAGAAGGAAGAGAGGAQAPETVLVVFIGGVTFAEISALRWLGSRPEAPHRFVVLTTKIVNGRTLLQSFMDPLAARVGECVGLQG